MTTPFFALIRKDLRLFFGDRHAVIMSFVAPILIGAFFGYVFGGGASKQETGRIAVLLVDQDNSAISHALLADLRTNKNLDVQPAAAAEAREAVRKGNATVAILIPKDFGKAAGNAFFRTQAKPEIGVLYDPSHAAAGIFDVARVTRDQVNVNVEHRLPGGLADVHPDVVALG